MLKIVFESYMLRESIIRLLVPFAYIVSFNQVGNKGNVSIGWTWLVCPLGKICFYGFKCLQRGPVLCESMCVCVCACKSVCVCIPEAECIINGIYYENGRPCRLIELPADCSLAFHSSVFFSSPQYVQYCLKLWGQEYIFFFWKKIYTFSQEGCINFIKGENKDIYATKDSRFK